MDEDNCMVDVASLHFEDNVVNVCVVKHQNGNLAITEGKGKEEDLLLLEEIAWVTTNASLCALGGTAANPVLSTLKYFRDEYEAHIKEKRCPAKVCKALITYVIDQEKCTGCGLCQTLCPEKAIEGEKEAPMTIDAQKCSRCGICLEACRFEAINVTS